MNIIKNSKFKMGQRIKHGKSYSMTCERFQYRETTPNEPFSWQRNTEPTPLSLQGEGYVIGLKMAIMSDYHYEGSKGDREDYEQAIAWGKREECLVCVKALKPFKPYLVRVQDVV